MRIIAGEFRGRRLAGVKGGVRPTSDRVREAIFSILGEGVAGARVLDLFAGTGALALEALSRGAGSAVLVEEAPAALAVIRRNVAALGVEARVRLLPLPVAGAIKKLAQAGERFDLIFLDPPYGRGLAAATLQLLGEGGVLAAGARVVAEMSRRESPPPAAGCLTLTDLRRYGDTQVAFYGPAAVDDEKEP
ncbi:MAG: 16S rRNA (guanine(966)-N(2))-methyltransferase RsmD [Syntrophobacterales bacterium]|nr:16S rRNA (guanine(966)-N(2))-methyltransferase RsmD [Syntrophobacterales bacterium]